MKLRYVVTGLMAGVAGGAIAAAPMASAANPSTVTDNGRTTVVDKHGHNAIIVKPPAVSSPICYGQFSSPAPDHVLRLSRGRHGEPPRPTAAPRRAVESIGRNRLHGPLASQTT